MKLNSCGHKQLMHHRQWLRTPRNQIRDGEKRRTIFESILHILIMVKVRLSLCLTKHHAMKACWGSGSVAPRILDLGTSRRWVVSFTPRPLYPQGKSPWYSLDRRLGGPQSRSGWVFLKSSKQSGCKLRCHLAYLWAQAARLYVEDTKWNCK
jgi:hypothetical protein